MAHEEFLCDNIAWMRDPELQRILKIFEAHGPLTEAEEGRIYKENARDLWDFTACENEEECDCGKYVTEEKRQKTLAKLEAHFKKLNGQK